MGNNSSQPRIEDPEALPATSSSPEIPPYSQTEHEHAEAGVSPRLYAIVQQTTSQDSSSDSPVFIPERSPDTAAQDINMADIAQYSTPTPKKKKRKRKSSTEIEVPMSSTRNVDNAYWDQAALASNAFELPSIERLSSRKRSKKRKLGSQDEVTRSSPYTESSRNAGSHLGSMDLETPSKNKKRRKEKRKAQKERPNKQATGTPTVDKDGTTEIVANAGEGNTVTVEAKETQSPRKKKKKKREKEGKEGKEGKDVNDKEREDPSVGIPHDQEVEAPETHQVSTGQISYHGPKAAVPPSASDMSAVQTRGLRTSLTSRTAKRPISKDFIVSDTESEYDAPETPRLPSEEIDEVTTEGSKAYKTTPQEETFEGFLGEGGPEATQSTREHPREPANGYLAMSSVKRGKQPATTPINGWSEVNNLLSSDQVLSESKNTSGRSTPSVALSGKKRSLQSTSRESAKIRSQAREKPAARPSSSKMSTPKEAIAVVVEAPASSSAISQEMTLKSGPFSEDEKEAIERFRDEWCKENKQNQLQFTARCHENARNIRSAQIFWLEMREYLPNRPTVALQKYCRRKFHNYAKRGAKWTAEEDKEVRRLYAKHGSRWVEIGKELERHPEDIRDRYRNYLAVPDREERRWSNFDIETLRKSVGNCAVRIMEEDCEIEDEFTSGLYLNTHMDAFLRNAPTLLNWEAVSKEMKGKRSRLQCSYKWRALVDSGKTTLRREIINAWERLVQQKTGDTQNLREHYNEDIEGHGGRNNNPGDELTLQAGVDEEESGGESSEGVLPNDESEQEASHANVSDEEVDHKDSSSGSSYVKNSDARQRRKAEKSNGAEQKIRDGPQIDEDETSSSGSSSTPNEEPPASLPNDSWWSRVSSSIQNSIDRQKKRPPNS